MLSKIRQGIGLFLIGIAVIILVWSEWQYPRQIKNSPINFEEFQFADIIGDNSSIPEPRVVKTPGSMQILQEEFLEEFSVPTTYRLLLDSPTKIRVGDTEIIRLDIMKTSPPTNEITKSMNGNPEQITTEPIPQIPAQYNTLVETRLDLTGIMFAPTGDVITPFQPEQVLRFYWTVQPDKPGLYQGVVWLHVQYVAKDGSETFRQLISTQLLKLIAIDFCGLRSDIARLLGSIGFFIGLALELDLLINIMKKLMKGKQTHA